MNKDYPTTNFLSELRVRPPSTCRTTARALTSASASATHLTTYQPYRYRPTTLPSDDSASSSSWIVHTCSQLAVQLVCRQPLPLEWCGKKSSEEPLADCHSRAHGRGAHGRGGGRAAAGAGGSRGCATVSSRTRALGLPLWATTQTVSSGPRLECQEPKFGRMFSIHAHAHVNAYRRCVMRLST